MINKIKKIVLYMNVHSNNPKSMITLMLVSLVLSLLPHDLCIAQTIGESDRVKNAKNYFDSKYSAVNWTKILPYDFELSGNPADYAEVQLNISKGEYDYLVKRTDITAHDDSELAYNNGVVDLSKTKNNDFTKILKECPYKKTFEEM